MMDEDEKDSVEHLPQPEMTQSPKRTKTKKMSNNIQNPP